jgi:isopenicillin-N N-acyltransferase-like protein
MLVVRASGTPYEIGYAHGRQITGITSDLEEVSRWILRAGPSITWEEAQTKAVRLSEQLEEHAPSLLQELNGLIEGARWDRNEALVYQMLPYVAKIRLKGCTVMVASGESTIDGEPVLAKTKDYLYAFRPYQIAMVVTNSAEQDYIVYGIAGWVGCDQGLNEAGFASVLTWCETDCRGLGIQSHMLHKLLVQKAKSVEDGIHVASNAERTGMCNYVMLDRTGDTAVFENAHSTCAVRRMGPEGILVCTNHFVDNSMKQCTPHINETYLPEDLAWTHARYDRAVSLLFAARGTIDVGYMKTAVQDHFHGAARFSICNHGRDEGTISCFIAVPRRNQVLIQEGYPCQKVGFQEFSL